MTILVLGLLFTVSIANPTAVELGFDHFYNLEHDQAIAEFQKLASAQPQDPFLENYLALALLYRELYRGGVL